MSEKISLDSSENIYNISLSPPIVTQSNLTFQIKGYTRNYRFLRLDYACVIYIAIE